MSAILLHARAVVHQHQVQVVVGPAGAGIGDRGAGGGLHGVPLPAPVERARLLERLVGGAHVI
jgi:hypothetical protein